NGMTAFGGWSLERVEKSKVEKSKVEKSKAKPRWNLESAILNLQSSICYLLSTISPRSPRFHRALDQRGSREAWNNRDRDYAAAGGLDFLAAHDLGRSPVGALREHLRQHARDQRPGCEVVKDGHVVHALERRQDFGPLTLGQNRPPRAFERAHAAVAIHGHQERVSELAGFRKIPRVPRMEHVKAAVSEDHPLALQLQFGDGFN